MTLDDLGPVVEIEQESPSPWTPELITDELLLPKPIVLVVVGDEGTVLGWCCARAVAGEAELLKIAVRSTRRRAGVAEGLLLHLEKTLSALKVESLFLEVRSCNDPALCFYRLHGFKEIGHRPGYYSNPVDDALIFSKTLM